MFNIKLYSFSIGLFLSFVFIFNVKISSQTYDFQNIGERKKLKEKYIYDINQSADRRLLLATEKGLTFFDGQKFITTDYLKESNDKILNKVFVSKTGVIYLGYFNGTIVKIDNGIDKKISTEQGKVVKFSENSKGEIFYLIQGKGIFKLEQNTPVKIQSKGISAEEIRDFQFLNEKLIITGESHVKFYDGKFNLIEEKITADYSNLERPQLFYDNIGNRILLIDQMNRILWIEESAKDLLVQEISGVIANDSRVEDVAFDMTGGVWFATKSNGLYKLQLSNGEVGSFSMKHYSKANGLTENQLKSVFCDIQNVLWIGYYGYGLSKLENENIVLINQIDNSKINDVNSIESNEKGELLIGTDIGLFNVHLGVDARVENIGNVLNIKDVQVVKRDVNNNIWVGTKEGLYQIDKNGKVIDLGQKHNSKYNLITCITPKSNGNVYVGTDLGMLFYSENPNAIQRITTNEGLVHNVLNDILVSSDSTIWFASNGASLFSYKNGEYTVHKNINNLDQYVLRDIIELSNGDICFGTETDGVFIVKGDSVRQISLTNGLLSNAVYSLIQDETGVIWAFHKRSITKFNSNLEVIEYLKEDALYNAEINKKSVYQDISGVIWLGTNKGIIKFGSSKFQDTLSPTIIIESVSWNNSIVSSIPEESPYGTYNFKIHFFGVDLRKSDDITYEYQLEGLENGWNKVGKDQTSVNYPKLQDGSYVFKVRAINSLDKISNEISLPFTIGIPFWKTWWFIILTPFLLMVIVVSFVQWRIGRIKKQKLELESIVRKRTYELRVEKNNLNEAKVLIEHKNKEITDSINYAERIQKALLPDISKSRIKKGELFVFFSPCDIVSGDFYWLGYKNGKSIIVTADCTGHGVPGAFMSMISSTLLDKIIIDNGITDPEIIVEKLDAGLIEALRSSESKSKDGIDIGIIVLDEDNQKLIYCGASRPLFMYRQNELEVFKGGMLSVGEFIDGIEKEYIRHEINYQSGDQFYVSSDGFPDQFGGKSDRKYMVGKFKKFLAQLSKLPMEKQQSVMKNEFLDWKGDNHQTDDVLVIGLKL